MSSIKKVTTGKSKKEKSTKEKKISSNLTEEPNQEKSNINAEHRRFDMVDSSSYDEQNENTGEEPMQSTSTATPPPHLAKDPIISYIQNVSPIKVSKKGYSYFNFKVQTKSHVIEGVSFEPTLQKIMAEKQETQRPTKISNYSLKRSLREQDDDTLVINKRTKLDNITDCNFNFQKVDFSKLTKIEDIKDLSDYSVVTIIGQVNITSEITSIEAKHKSLEKLECKIGDDTDSINITFWGEQIEKITDKFTYKIENIRVRTYQGNKCLSCNPDTIISSALPIVNITKSLFEETSSEVSLEVEEIECISEFNYFYNCKHCGKKLQECQTKIQQCNICGVKQLIKPTDEKNISVIIHFKKENDQSITLFKQHIEELVTIYNNQNNDTITIADNNESKLTEIILCITNIKIFYNKTTNIATKIEPMK